MISTENLGYLSVILVFPLNLPFKKFRFSVQTEFKKLGVCDFFVFISKNLAKNCIKSQSNPKISITLGLKTFLSIKFPDQFIDFYLFRSIKRKQAFNTRNWSSFYRNSISNFKSFWWLSQKFMQRILYRIMRTLSLSNYWFK